MKLNEEIAQIANVSLEVANQIRNYIEDEIGIDWSEASQRTIKSAINLAIKEMATI